MLPVIAFVCALASCVLGFWLQKNCKPTSIRFRGKKIEVAKKMVIAEISEVFIKNGKYYARCSIPGDTTQQTIEIDKAMMAAFPDQQDNGKPVLIKVVLYEETTDIGTKVYTLAPEEIRFKLNLHIVQDETKTLEDIRYATVIIEGYYQIRLVLWTLAWVGVYQSPMLSTLFSCIAAWISYTNVVPIRYTFLKECGIIKKKSSTPGNAKSHKSSVPPGYDNWTEEGRYLYSLEQRVNAQKDAGSQPYADVPSETEERREEPQESAGEKAETESVSGSPDVETDASNTDDSASVESDDDSDEEDEEDAPFFTDEELAQEDTGESEDVDTDDEDDPESSDSGTDSDSEFSASFDEEDGEDGEFEADGFEADEPKAERAAIESAADNKPETVPSDAGSEKQPNPQTAAPASSGRRKKEKMTVKDVLDTLMDDNDSE